MTLPTHQRGTNVGRRCVAVFTGRRRMYSDQREPGEVMVEEHSSAPAQWVVTPIALFAEFSFMDVISLVTGDALGRKLGV
jgi:hypothetical protein